MKKIYLVTLFLIFFAGMISSQFFYDQSKAKADYSEPNLFKSDLIKAIDLGLHNAAGDLYWLAGIQYFGGAESQTYEKLFDYLNLSSDLNPQFPYPYAFGTLVLPSIGQTDQAIELAKKGIDKSSPDWRISYYLGAIYHINKDDTANAVKYFDLASRTEGVPDGIKKVSANFGTRGEKRQKTKEIWIGIYETSKDELVKERARDYIAHYEILDFLEEAANQYRNINGSFPKEVSDLVSGNILKAIPPDPFGLEFAIDEKGHINVK